MFKATWVASSNNSGFASTDEILILFRKPVQNLSSSSSFLIPDILNVMFRSSSKYSEIERLWHIFLRRWGPFLCLPRGTNSCLNICLIFSQLFATASFCPVSFITEYHEVAAMRFKGEAARSTFVGSEGESFPTSISMKLFSIWERQSSTFRTSRLPTHALVLFGFKSIGILNLLSSEFQIISWIK